MTSDTIARMMRMVGVKRAPDGDRFRKLGDHARDRGEWIEAVINYRAYLNRRPDAFPIWVQLGHVSKEAGDFDASEQAYLHALGLRPDDADLLLNLGHFTKSRGRLDDAVDYYSRSAVNDLTGNAQRELAGLGRSPGIAPSVPAEIHDAPVPPTLPGTLSPFLNGVLDVPHRGPGPIVVQLTEGGVEVARTIAEGAGRRRGFAFRLPADLCDGRPHGFEVIVDGEIVARIPTITPGFLTPSDVLVDYASRELRGRMSLVAGWRYAALAEQGERLVADPAVASEWPSIAAAHRYLIDGPERAGLDFSFAPLDFPVVDDPVMSVVVPVHNSFAFTYRCLASLRIMPNLASFEVIVVDDGSSDRTTELESIVTGIRIVRHETATGFVGACNDGGAAARGQYIVLLNNDTEVSPHWIDRLIEPFDLFDDVGLVGAKLVFADGRLQEAGGIVWRDGRAANYGRLGSTRDPRYNYLRETDYCSGACIALRRTVWEELGGFDPAFAPAYYEDTDIAFRVRALGLKVLYQPLVEILHFEGVSNGTDLGTGMKRHQVLNQPKFLERWGAGLRAHGDSRAPDAKQIERGYPRRVLVIDTEVPQPDRSAGHHAAIQEIRLLQSLGYRPTFLPINLAYLGRYSDVMAGMGVETICAPFYLSMEEYIGAHGGVFDLVYITRYSVAAEIVPLIRRHCPEASIVFNNADLHFLRAIRDAIDESDPEKRIEATIIRETELEVMRSVDLTLSYNVVEHAVIQSHTMGEVKVALCPWVVEPRDAGPVFAEREGIAFLGGYRHPPNRRAVEFFVKEVMPVLRKRRPGIVFHVYGSSVPAEFDRLACEDVVIDGFIDDVATAMDRSRVFVAPLRSGAGIKGKVLEALASGLPSVLSPIAAEGTGVRDGLEAAIAETPMEWAEAIARFYDDEAAWRAMADASRRFVTENHSFERGREVMKRGFNDHGIATLTGMAARTIPRIG